MFVNYIFSNLFIFYTVITNICWALVVFTTNVCINCIQVLISNVPQAHLFILLLVEVIYL